MKNIVSHDDYFETELKPRALKKEYISRCKDDIRKFFLGDRTLYECECPGCLTTTVDSSFEKFGLKYVECSSCHTLRISPRPDDDTIQQYYKQSDARRFWLEEISQGTRSKRLEKIIKPRFEWIIDSTMEYLPSAHHILDINTLQSLVVEELSVIPLFGKKTILQPLSNFSELERKNINVFDNLDNISDLHNDVDVVTLFEVVDRTGDIETLFARVHRMLKNDGLCFMTDILASGFDIQFLWDKAENLIPPDRLNVFTVEGLNNLFSRHGFRCLEFSTPGILDTEIVATAIENDPGLALPRFIKNMLSNREVNTRKSLQKFLQANLLSSYGRILLQKI